jgi:hypothetical protein
MRGFYYLNEANMTNEKIINGKQEQNQARFRSLEEDSKADEMLANQENELRQKQEEEKELNELKKELDPEKREQEINIQTYENNLKIHTKTKKENFGTMYWKNLKDSLYSFSTAIFTLRVSKGTQILSKIFIFFSLVIPALIGGFFILFLIPVLIIIWLIYILSETFVSLLKKIEQDILAHKNKIQEALSTYKNKPWERKFYKFAGYRIILARLQKI